MEAKKNTLIVLIIVIIVSIGIIAVLHLDDDDDDNDDNDDNLEPDPIQYEGFEVIWMNRTENNDYKLGIRSVDAKNLASVEDISFTLYDQDRKDKSNGEHSVSNVYGVPIDDKNFISFGDGDHDGLLTIGDRFIIKSKDPVDDDGSTDSPGYAEPGFSFVVRIDEVKIIDVELP